MTKTQIQLPEELYERVKDFAKEREWSLAETFRRGVEELLRHYPAKPIAQREWHPPKGRNLGYKEMSEDQLKRHAQEDFD